MSKGPPLLRVLSRPATSMLSGLGAMATSQLSGLVATALIRCEIGPLASSTLKGPAQGSPRQCGMWERAGPSHKFPNHSHSRSRQQTKDFFLCALCSRSLTRPYDFSINASMPPGGWFFVGSSLTAEREAACTLVWGTSASVISAGRRSCSPPRCAARAMQPACLDVHMRCERVRVHFANVWTPYPPDPGAANSPGLTRACRRQLSPPPSQGLIKLVYVATL